MVDYVYGRSVGEKAQEVSGVMVTLAALCLANGLDIHLAGEVELARIWTKVEQIRAKQAAKPKHSPLPVAPAAPVPAHGREADRQRFSDPDVNRWLDESVSNCHPVWETVGDIAAAWAGCDNRQFYAAPVAPAGYKLVPIEPTESMVVRGFESEPFFGFSKPEVWGASEKMSGCQQAAFRAKLCRARHARRCPGNVEGSPLPGPRHWEAHYMSRYSVDGAKWELNMHQAVWNDWAEQLNAFMANGQHA